MKTRLLIVCVFLAGAAQAAAPMARVIAVNDSRTIVVESEGRRSTIALAAISIEPPDESAAAAYLLQLVGNTWVYVETGNVYRSPDGLYVNGEMQRRPWRAIAGMRYLGEVNPGPAVRPQRPPAKAASPAKAPRPAPLPRVRSLRRR